MEGGEVRGKVGTEGRREWGGEGEEGREEVPWVPGGEGKLKRSALHPPKYLLSRLYFQIFESAVF